MPTIPVISMVDIEMSVIGVGFLPLVPLFETLMRSVSLTKTNAEAPVLVPYLEMVSVRGVRTG
jgi:hypothetical protein